MSETFSRQDWIQEQKQTLITECFNALGSNINWDDLKTITSLENIFKDDTTELYSESKNMLKDSVVKMLQQWFTVHNEATYDALKKLTHIAKTNIKLPELETLLSLSKLYYSRFSLVYNSNNTIDLYKISKTNKVTLEWEIDPVTGWYTTDVNNWKYAFGSGDNLGNNNQFSYQSEIAINNDINRMQWENEQIKEQLASIWREIQNARKFHKANVQETQNIKQYLKNWVDPSSMA